MKNSFFIVIFLLVTKVFAQGQTFLLIYNNEPLENVIKDLENKYNINFSYKSDLLLNKKITYNSKKANLQDVLSYISSNYNLEIERVKDTKYYIILQKNEDILSNIQKIDKVIVKAYLTRGIDKKNDESYTIRPKKLGVLSGLAEPDVLESIQQLPGVVSLDESATNFSVRGGAYDQNSIYWNGIRIYQGGHLFGMISPFNPFVIKKVKFYNKAIPAHYEGGLSSIIELIGEKKVNNNLRIESGLNAISGDVTAVVPIVKNKLSAIISGRSSYQSIFFTPTMKSIQEKVFKNTNIEYSNISINKFSFNDFSFQLNSKLFKNNKISLSYIHIQSDLDFTHQFQNDIQYRYNNYLKIYTDGISVSSKSKINDKLIINTQYALSWYDLLFEDNTIKNQIKISNINKENFVSDMHFYANSEYQINPSNYIKTGYQFIQKRNAYLFDLNVDSQNYLFDYFRNTFNTHSLFVNYHYNKKKRLNFYSGLRIYYPMHLKKIFIEPRFIISKQLLPKLQIHLSGQILHQDIFQQDKSIIGLLNLENKIWQISNDKLPVLSSYQTNLGLIYKKNNLILETNVYQKFLKNINLSFPYRVYNKSNYLFGNENIKGIEFFAKQKTGRFTGWISYSIMQAQYRFDNLKNNKYFTSDKEIKNSLTTTILYESNKFNVAAGWTWHSPGVYYNNIVQEQNDPSKEQIINENFSIKKLDSYSSVNLSASYQFKPHKKSKSNFKISVSVRNLLNKKNLLSVEQNSYSLNTEILDFDKYGFNRTYNISLRYRFFYPVINRTF